MAEYVPLALATLVCTAPLVAAVHGAHQQFAKPKPITPTIDWPLTWAQHRARSLADHRPASQLTVMELHLREVLRVRWNGHCAICGRFGKKVPELAGAVECATHGLTTHVIAHLEGIAA